MLILFKLDILTRVRSRPFSSMSHAPTLLLSSSPYKQAQHYFGNTPGKRQIYASQGLADPGFRYLRPHKLTDWFNNGHRFIGI